jgi:transposase-like protein
MSLSTKSARALFKDRHFTSEIVTLCVRGHITSKLSYQDLQAMMAERGISIAPTAILCWVQWYVLEFMKRWHPYD